DSVRLSASTPSWIRSAEMAEMVEWLRPVIAAISVRDGCPALRTAPIAMARLRRRRSSWRIPTVMVSFCPPINRYGWPASLGHICGPITLPSIISSFEKSMVRTPFSIDSHLSLSHYFFEARQNRASHHPRSLVRSARWRSREEVMRKFTTAILAGAAMSLVLVSAAQAKDKIIGVSWSNFQEERWKTDEAAIKKQLEANGDKYISADAQSSA